MDSRRKEFQDAKRRFLAGARNDKPIWFIKGKRRRVAPRLLFPNPDKTELSFRMERSGMRNLPNALPLWRDEFSEDNLPLHICALVPCTLLLSFVFCLLSSFEVFRISPLSINHFSIGQRYSGFKATLAIFS